MPHVEVPPSSGRVRDARRFQERHRAVAQAVKGKLGGFARGVAALARALVRDRLGEAGGHEDFAEAIRERARARGRGAARKERCVWIVASGERVTPVRDQSWPDFGTRM